MFLDKVRGLLVGKTILDVEEIQTDGMDRVTDDDAVQQEGIRLHLDDGSQVDLLVDYDEVSFLVQEV
jgi:hypothetical protein